MPTKKQKYQRLVDWIVSSPILSNLDRTILSQAMYLKAPKVFESLDLNKWQSKLQDFIINSKSEWGKYLEEIRR